MFVPKIRIRYICNDQCSWQNLSPQILFTGILLQTLCKTEQMFWRPHWSFRLYARRALTSFCENLDVMKTGSEFCC